MSGEHRKPSFSSTDAVDATEYPRINRAAVMALLFGFASVGAMVNPLLWFLPLAGVVLAIIALRSIARSDEVMLGRRAAVVGLVLGLVFISWAPCRYFVRHELLYRQAREHGEYWLGLVQEGRLHEAHQLTLDKAERQPANANLNEIYLDMEPLAESYEGFIQDSPMDKVIALGGKGRVRFVGREEIQSYTQVGSALDVVKEQLAIEYDEDGRRQTIPLVLHIARSRPLGSREASWKVREIDDPSRRKN